MALFVFVALQSGCWTYTPGTQLSSRPIPGSEHVISTVRSIEVVEMPSIDSPGFAVKAVMRDSVTFMRARTYAVIKANNQAAFAGVSLASAGFAYLAISHGDSVTTKGLTLNGIGVAAGLTSLLSLIGALEPGPRVDPGKTIYDSVPTVGPTRVRFDPSPRAVDIVIGGITKRVVATPTAAGRINLVTDFGLRRFDSERQVEVKMTIPGLVETTTVRLNTASWMEQCVQLKGSGTIWSDPTARSSEVGKFKTGETYPSSGVADAWIRISTERGTTGWVPKDATTSFWQARSERRCG